MKRRYRVFVSYLYFKDDRDSGVGNAEIRLKPFRKNLTHNVIDQLQNLIQKENKYDTVIILNYQIM